LRADNDLHAPTVEILDSVECLGWIEIRIPNKESEPRWMKMRADGFEVRGCNLQCGNGVFAESRPPVSQIGKHANLHRSLRTISRSNFCCGTDHRQNQCANDDAKHNNPNFHNGRNHPERCETVKNDQNRALKVL
jgi:hypothetical protein